MSITCNHHHPNLIFVLALNTLPFFQLKLTTIIVTHAAVAARNSQRQMAYFTHNEVAESMARSIIGRTPPPSHPPLMLPLPPLDRQYFIDGSAGNTAYTNMAFDMT